MCSSLRGREPAAVSFTRYRCRVVRDPIGGGAAVNSPPFSKGDVCASRQRDSGGFFSHRSLNAHCAVNPSPSLSPVGSSLRGREPTAESFALFCAESSGSHLRRSRGQQSPFFKGGMSAPADRGILMGSSHWRFKCPLCSKPITISQPRGQLSSGKRAYC